MYLKNKKGVTLIELVLVIALIGIVLQVGYSIFFVGLDSYAVSNNKGFSQQEVRNATMFLESELKYANDFYTQEEVEDGIVNTVFYGLKRENEDLIVSEYRYIPDTAPVEYTVTQIRKYRTQNKVVLLKNKTPGMITLQIEQEETSGRRTSGYKIEDNIYLDDGAIFSDLEWNLSNESDVVYYSKTKDALKGSITLNQDNTDDEHDNEEEDGETTIPKSASISIVSITVKDATDPSSIVHGQDDKYKLSKNKAAFEIEFLYQYDGQESVIISSSLIANEGTLDHNTGNKKFTLKGQLPPGNEALEITVTISADDANVITKKLTLSKS